MDLIFETAVIGYLVILDAFSGIDDKNQYLYQHTLDYLNDLDECVEKTVMRLCKQVLQKGDKNYEPGNGKSVYYTKEEFKKFVPKEILEPTSFRFYCQFFEGPNDLPQDDEKEKLLFEKEIFDGISKSR